MKNSDIEFHYFEIFRKHAQLPKGEILYSDRPDVIIKGDQNIGIEIAFLYLADGKNESSEQVQIARRIKVVEKAQKIFLASGGKNIELSVTFDPSYPVTEIDLLAYKLANYALKIQNNESGPIFCNPDSEFGEISKEINWIYHNAKEYKNARWSPIQSYDAVNLSLQRVQEIVHQKKTKIDGYQKCDAYWLLLIVDFMNPAQDQYIDWPQSATIDKNPFENVIIYKHNFGQIVYAK